MIRKISKRIKSIDVIASSDISNPESGRRSEKLINGLASAKTSLAKFSKGMFKLTALTSGILVASSALLALKSTWEAPNNIREFEQSKSINSQNIGSHLGAVSLAMNEEFQRSDIVFISQYDSQLAHIVSNANDTIAPNYGEPEGKSLDKYFLYNGFRILGIFNDNDPKKHYAYTLINGEIMGQHALSIYEDQEERQGRKFCYIKSYKDNDFSGQLSSPIFFSPNEARTIIKHHEQGHCLDRKEITIELEGEEDDNIKDYILQAEILADVYAALRSIAVTGNTDTIRYTLLPFRTMPSNDHTHQSSTILHKFLELNLDIEKITHSSANELWEQAQKLVDTEFNFAEMKAERDAWFHAEEAFSELAGLIPSGKEEPIEAQAKSDKEVALEYGYNLYETMLNHYVYHDKLNDEKSLQALIKVAQRIGNLLDDNSLADGIEVIEEKVDNEETVGHIELADLIGVKITANSKAFEANDALLAKEHNDFVDRVLSIGDDLENKVYQRPSFLFEHKTQRDPKTVLSKQIDANTEDEFTL